MNNAKHIIHTILIALIVAIAAIYVLVPGPTNSPEYSDPNHKSVFDRIMSTREIRCGYYVFPPVTYRDPKTGDLSGFTVDMMNEIGRRAGLKIVWAEETNFVTWTESLKAGRFDVACTPNWPDTPLASVVAFSVPMFYAGMYPMVRANDPRFQSGDIIARLNQPDIRISTIEGDSIDSIVRQQFPNAVVNTLPKSSGDGTFVLDLITKKADMVLSDENGKIEFNRANPGKLKLLDQLPPVKMQPFVLAVDRNEMILKDYLDSAVQDLIYDGTMDRLLKKWEPEPGKTFLRVKIPVME